MISNKISRYAYHFPELYKLVSEQYKYVRCAATILERAKAVHDVEMPAKLTGCKQSWLSDPETAEILDGDEEKAAEVLKAANTSMGMDIAQLDLANIERFASRVASLTEYRQRLHAYIKDRMASCAPSLSALIGEQVR